jgi:predicted flap endonuclease-1-like 5' DNA nuclease
MAYKIAEIEGIGPQFGKKLESAKIMSTDDLPDRCGDPNGRKAIAAQTGINESQLLKWANMADLMRISGVGGQYAELLEAAGVDTIKELRNQNADNLTSSMLQINEQKHLANSSPASSLVQGWIEQAKKTDSHIKC